MSFHRVTLVALATFFTIGMTQFASACCDMGYAVPFAYAPVAPVTYGGCGGCGAPTAAAIYAQPVAPAPIYVTSVSSPFGGPCCSYGGCGGCGNVGYGGCGGCGAVSYGGCGGCGGQVGYAVAAPSLYVVNQGPVYSGPALTIPYSTYSPEAAYAPATDYPYVPGYGYGAPQYPRYFAQPSYPRYYRPRYAYRGPVYMRPRYDRPAPRYYGAPHWRHFP